MKKLKTGELKVKNLRKNKIIFILFFMSCIWPLACFSEVVSSSDLINSAKQYDQKEIVYKGEVIGDIMVRGDFAWVNANDGKNAIGIWLKSSLTKDVLYTGNYKAKGDIIEVVGIFNRACREHGGDLDIHARALKVIEKGSETVEDIPAFKIKVALGFLIICLTLTVIYFIRLTYGTRS